MHVTINGQAKVIEPPQTVEQMLEAMTLAPIRVAVEINESIISRKQFAQRTLRDGDRIEIVTFVGGG